MFVSVHNTSTPDYNKIFKVWAEAKMTKISEGDLKAKDMEELILILNADFANTTVAGKMDGIAQLFAEEGSNYSNLEYISKVSWICQFIMLL